MTTQEFQRLADDGCPHCPEYVARATPPPRLMWAVSVSAPRPGDVVWDVCFDVKVSRPEGEE